MTTEKVPLATMTTKSDNERLEISQVEYEDMTEKELIRIIKTLKKSIDAYEDSIKDIQERQIDIMKSVETHYTTINDALANTLKYKEDKLDIIHKIIDLEIKPIKEGGNNND